MTPLSSQPAVVEVQPSDHGSDVESTVDRVEDVRRARHTGAIRDNGSWDDGAEEFGAVGELEGFEAAAKRVEEDEASGVDLAACRSVLYSSLLRA